MSLNPHRLLPLLLACLALPLAASAVERKPRPAQSLASQLAPRAHPAKAAPAQPVQKARAPKLPVAQILQRHIAARGGQQAWRAVQSMSWSGRMEVGFADSAARSARYVSSAMARAGKQPRLSQPVNAADGGAAGSAAQQVQVPFAAEVKRPGKSRVEIQFAGKTAVQVFDGTRGWLQRPFLNRDDWEPFTAEQLKAQQARWDLDGPLMNAAAEGTKVELESVEVLEGHDAYKLKLTRKDGDVQHVWVDAKTFLDVRIEGTPRRMDGQTRTVWVTQRDFRTVQGLKVPFVQETAVDGYADTHKTVVEKVALNPRLDDGRFVRPRA